MRQETIVKTWLQFSELSAKGKAKAIDAHRDINTDHDWFDFMIEDYENKLKKLGFHNIKIYFSGFSSQGDGACFTASHRRGAIEHIGRYCHEMSMTCDNAALLEVARRIARELYRDLGREYDYLTSAEAIAEAIEANDIEFDADKYEGA